MVKHDVQIRPQTLALISEFSKYSDKIHLKDALIVCSNLLRTKGKIKKKKVGTFFDNS